jgi:iron(III) transport system substrate-binding protein
MQDLSAIAYDRTAKDIRARITAKDKVEEIRAAKELGEFFRANYAKAEAIAKGSGQR